MNNAPLGRDSLRQLALEVLEGVGDSALGQWEDWSGYAYHVRRRLSLAEQAHVGDMLDIRGTKEHKKRLAAIRKVLPLHLHYLKE